MPQSEDQNRADFMNAINRCAEAYHHVKAQLPKDANFVVEHRNNNEACQAWIANLPILFDPASFQAYIACIAQGVTLGVIDLLDVGRYCHLAQTAMSAWKLANLTVPAAPKKAGAPGLDSETWETHPLPSKGNHLEQEENRMAALHLPDRKTQNELYKSLRQRGIPVPSDVDLRNNPLVALYFCDLARNHLDKLPPIDNHLDPQPGQQPPQDQTQAA